MEVLAIVGGALSIIGAVFLLLAAVGIIRMPDVYNRMQAGTKATTLGSILFLLGIGLANPALLGKIALLIIFIVFTNPISSHALARAAHSAGVPATGKTVEDALRDDDEAIRRQQMSEESEEPPAPEASTAVAGDSHELEGAPAEEVDE